MPSARRMTFTCGVRFIRPRSAGDRGRLSRSVLAAASICLRVMGRKGCLVVFDEVVILLMLCCLSRRDNPHSTLPLSVDDRKHRSVRGAEQDEAVLVIGHPVIQPP